MGHSRTGKFYYNKYEKLKKPPHFTKMALLVQSYKRFKIWGYLPGRSLLIALGSIDCKCAFNL